MRCEDGGVKMTQTADLLYKMAEFFRSEEFFEKGEDARLELSPDDVRCMNKIIKACRNGISRQAVLDLLIENGIYGYEKKIAELPSIQPKPQTGHWNLFHTTEHGIREDSYFKCDRCNYESYKEYNFCPKCGARMEVEQNG